MNIFIVIFLSILVISLLLAIFKRVIVATIVGGIILILFCVSFVWDSNDLITNLGLDKVLKLETTQQITDIYDNYTERRSEHDIIINKK